MGKHLTSPLRNVLFFSHSLSSPLRAYSLSFYLSPPHQFSFLIYPQFLFSTLSLICSALYGTIHHFCCFTAFLHLRCFGRKLGAYIPEIFALLIITCDPKQYFSLIILLQYWHIHQFLISSSSPIHTHRYPIFFAIKSNQNIKL